MNKKLLEKIEKTLYWGAPGGKTEQEANQLIEYVALAYKEKPNNIPKEYQSFAQEMKKYWEEMGDLSLSEKKKFLHTKILNLIGEK